MTLLKFSDRSIPGDSEVFVGEFDPGLDPGENMDDLFADRAYPPRKASAELFE